ncbi:FAD/NAD(P)-binding domain [Trinorchestia longiramus]|nr:FAD/NAD(P)-binding domain [Trinorchestia longiramus]
MIASHCKRQLLQCILHHTCRAALSLPSAGATNVPKVCIIGTGPAGFYTAMKLIKEHPSVCVDMYEKLAVPHGLVRYGVAPDHPEVKNCINQFTSVANTDRCFFLGNVTIGKDVTVPELRDNYHAVVVASGAWEDRKLNIPGEENMLSARRLVGWYNGLPQDSWLKPPLHQAEHAVVVGQGNVALDVARILLSPVDRLKSFDVPEAVLEQLSQSRVRRVTLLGRRAPQHVAFTTKELREMTKIDSFGYDVRSEDCHHLPAYSENLERARRRLLQLVHQCSLDSLTTTTRERIWALRFLRSPCAVTVQDGVVTGLTLSRNRLEGDRAVPTGDTEELACDLVVRSAGYMGTKFDPALPYREDTGTIANVNSRVTGLPGVYATGWAGSGPVGVIVSTMTDSFQCAKIILKDLEQHQDTSPKQGKDTVLPLLQSRGVKVVLQPGAERILSTEAELGANLGKLREKITSHESMLEIADSAQSNSASDQKKDAAPQSPGNVYWRFCSRLCSKTNVLNCELQQHWLSCLGTPCCGHAPIVAMRPLWPCAHCGHAPVVAMRPLLPCAHCCHVFLTVTRNGGSQRAPDLSVV